MIKNDCTFEEFENMLHLVLDQEINAFKVKENEYIENGIDVNSFF